MAYLSSKFALSCFCDVRASVPFVLCAAHAHMQSMPPPPPQVGATSGVQVVATALTQRIREGIVPCLTGMGVDAVSGFSCQSLVSAVGLRLGALCVIIQDCRMLAKTCLANPSLCIAELP